MEEEEEVCRVCRGEATIDEPLFHPCKCSGSIGYVHQDCLVDWLSHSNKPYCELCNYYYQFTPIYKDDMPTVLPPSIFINHIESRLYTVCKWTLRISIVAFIWLGLVPFITVWIWRFYFWNANTMFYYMNTIVQTRKLEFYTNNVPPTVYRSTTERVLYDCLEGWVIACVFTLTVVAGFLLREWIRQNVFLGLDDEPLDQQEEIELPIPEPIEQLQEPVVPTDESFSGRRRKRSIVSRPQHEEDYENLEAMWKSDADIEPVDQINIEPQIPTIPAEGTSSGRRRKRPTVTRPQYVEEDYENLEAMWRSDPDIKPVDQVDKQLPDPIESLIPAEGSSSGSQRRHKRSTVNRLHSEEDYENLEAMWRSDADISTERRSEANIIDALSIESDSVFDDDGYQQLVAPNEEHDVAAHDEIQDQPARGPEDINGVLEAIGIKGSLYILFQNSGLMSLLMFLCLGGGVWIPYILGAFFIALQPWRGVYVIVDLIADCISSMPLYKHTAKIVQMFIPTVTTTMPEKTYNSLWLDYYFVPSCEWVIRMFDDVPTGHRVVDRSICITTGYLILVISGSMYLSRSHYASIGRTARQVIRQLGLFLKVTLFIWIEVVFFPIGCGLLLDLVALCMFYETSGAGHVMAIHKRMLFLKDNVASSIFIHWIVGTTCIFILTSMVSFCRDNVRPGVFWFMRDPNDNNNPFKELVERSVASQLQKTLASSLLYGFVIEFGIGGLIVITGTLFEDIFPLKWSYSQPLITLPIDLLIVMFVIPYLIEYIHPKQVLRNLMVRWIKWLCHKLRLTSFLLGIRQEGNGGKYIKIPTEETQIGFQLARLFTFLPKNIEIVQEEDEDAIYIPPFFQIRMMLFCLFMWIFWSGLLCYLFVGPISIGRFILARYTSKRIHDVYSYFIGLSVLLAVCIVIKQLKNHRFKHILSWMLNSIIIILCFGVIMPILFGFLLQFYVIIPSQEWTQSPIIQPFQLWINGVICFYLFQILLPNQNHIKTALLQFQSNGVQGFKIKKEFKELIGPMIVITMAANFLPFIIVKGIVETRNQIQTLQMLYPCLIGTYFLYYLVKLMIMMCRKWTKSIRDDYYLTGRILHNHK